MNKIVRLALRNLTRQKRRSVILAIAIAFGFFVVTAIDGLTSGAVGNLEDSITQLTGGTVLIGGYEKIPSPEKEGKDQLVNIIRDHDYIKNIVESNGIKYRYFSRFTSSTGQLMFNGKKVLVATYGRDFSEPELRDSFQIAEGSYENLLSDPNAIVINSQLADTLNVHVGDNVIYTTMTIYGQNNFADFTVGAIIKSSNLLTGLMAYTNIETLNSIVGIPEGGYSTFTIFLKNKNEQARVANKIESIIRADGVNVSSRMQAISSNPNNPGRGIDKQFVNKEYQWEGVKYGVETLNDEIPAIKTVLTVVHTITTIILLVILLIVMVGVSNTYRMVLYERIREIGTMRALGMSGKDTGRVFTAEALILCIFGAIAGMLFAIIVMVCLGFIPITNESVSFFLHNGRMSFILSPASILIQYVLMMILTVFAVRGSAKQAAKLSPAEALRTVK